MVMVTASTSSRACHQLMKRSVADDNKQNAGDEDDEKAEEDNGEKEGEDNHNNITVSTSLGALQSADDEVSGDNKHNNREGDNK